MRAVAAYLERRHALATFNPADAHPAIALSRARHAASCRQLPPRPALTQPPPAPAADNGVEVSSSNSTTDEGSGLDSKMADSEAASLPSSGCASVRGVVPVLHNRYVYLQFSVLAAPPPMDNNGASGSSIGGSGIGGSAKGSGEDNVIMVVGLSTSGMRLDCAPGACAHSIGLTTDGRLLVGGRTYGAFAAPPATANPSGLDSAAAAARARASTTADASATSTDEEAEEVNLSHPPRRMEFGAGSTVGMLVFRDNDAEDDDDEASSSSGGDASSSSSSGWAAVWAAFTVDGIAVTCIELNGNDEAIGAGPGSSGSGDSNEGFGGSLVRLLVPRNAVVFPTATFVSSGSSSSSGADSGTPGTGGGPACRLAVRGRFSAGDLVGDDRPGILSGQPGAASPKPGVPTPDPCAARAAPPDCTVYALDGSIVRMPLVLPLNDA